MMTAKVHELNAWRHNLDMGEKGPKKNLTNLMLHLKSLRGLGDELKFNELTGNIEWKGRDLRDTDYVDIRIIIEQAGFDPKAQDVPIAVLRTAEYSAYNPVQDYLNGLQWDGVKRCSVWLHSVFDADNNLINSAFGKMFLIGAVARALDPGAKMDTMLILEGEQGIRKSSAVAALFGADYVMNGLPGFKGQEAALALQGKWAVDLGELAGFGKTDIRTIKNYLTLTIDNYRPLWAKHYINRPRRVVFVGSTNEHAYLDDPTGARRFWPVACRTVHLEKLIAIRDQLWAEAVQLYRDGEPWWIDRGSELDALANEQQADRFQEDPWAPDIDSYLQSPDVKYRVCVTAAEILKWLNVPVDRRDARSESRVTKHLTYRGWGRVRCMRHGLNVNWWFPADQMPETKQGRKA
jgi:putative DNA primase/helicase